METNTDLTLLDKGKLACNKRNKESIDRQLIKDNEIYEKMIKTANERFGGEFSWSPSKAGQYYIIINPETMIALGSLTGMGLFYIKKCKDCDELINSVEVYLADLPLVKDGSIKSHHNCTEKQSNPEEILLSAIENYVIGIVEDYQHN